MHLSPQALIQDFFQWCYYSNDYALIRNSNYAIPVLQTLHIVGILLLLGITLVLNVRLLELGFRNSPLPLLAHDLWAWAKIGIFLALVSGIMVFMTDPARYSHSGPFRFKMCLFCVAILYQSTVFRKIVSKAPEVRPQIFNAAAAALSMVLWCGVGFSGRAIAFFH